MLIEKIILSLSVFHFLLSTKAPVNDNIIVAI